jgi:hypothetical protein
MTRRIALEFLEVYTERSLPYCLSALLVPVQSFASPTQQETLSLMLARKWSAQEADIIFSYRKR